MKNKYENIEFIHVGNFEDIKQIKKFSPSLIKGMKRVAQIFPFRTNHYVVNELIDWNNVPDDPIFRLNFPHPDMLSYANHIILKSIKDSSLEFHSDVINQIRNSLNPNPAGQIDNVPTMDNEKVKGIQHKYAETVLVFPSEGQTCHAFCTFCFRWPQFIGNNDLKFSTDESLRYQQYISQHNEITDVLLTGGDPMIMNANILKLYIEPFLRPEFDHIQTIRIGSKTLAYWPFRYISDKDSKEVLYLFEKVVKAGKHLAFQAHFCHPVELQSKYAKLAIKNIQSTGAIIRSQSPILNYINNDPEIWHKLWNKQCSLGIVPYYMFVPRNTGAHHYFAVPLARAYHVFNNVFSRISGLCRTVRGPSMSTRHGKIKIDGITRIFGQKVFILSFLESRNPEWINRPFFAKYCENATWLDELQPAFDEFNFFFEKKPLQIKQKKKKFKRIH